ncbi:uncharacterized protein LOC126791102 [Argentina anserina]|uniref:uncharacterized protein LOC126791102 n=1 Tax=Argentina anserina TaxID=57926 RepID=UPI002176950D|nr:uncharacterized protein LOC126791102 [Potentilla anserina]
MAGARLCATFPSLANPILPATSPPQKPTSASLSLPSKLPRRKNYLRPKILKTLNPIPDPPQPVLPLESPANPSQDNREPEYTSEQGAVDSEKGAEVAEFTAAELSGISGKLSARDVLKYGGYFVGLFLLQTVVSVLFLGDSDTDENRKSRSLNTSSVAQSGNVVGFDESKVVEKVEEIRAMARRARQIEKNELKGSGGGGGGDEGFSKPKRKFGIEKEVGNKLVSLQKRLGKKREMLPGSFVNYLEMSAMFGDAVRKSGENGKEGAGELMFKKKMKFKTPNAEVERNPKGFGGEKEDGGAVKGNASVGTDGMELVEADEEEKTRQILEKGTMGLDEGQDREAGNMAPQNGTVRRTIEGKSASENARSIKPRGFGQKSPASLKKEVKGTTVKPAASSVNSSSKQDGVEKQALGSKVRGKQAENGSDPWWLHLPFVLVIFMRRGSDGQGGLFSVELNSQSQNESDASYTVAFEDRGDATNFCFLLESCFEDEDDFAASAAPLPNKELHKAIKSDGMKVIVVKKGQLKLYAGQPFAEVEMALRSLVVQS